jgi:hypothetical protein
MIAVGILQNSLRRSWTSHPCPFNGLAPVPADISRRRPRRAAERESVE